MLHGQQVLVAIADVENDGTGVGFGIVAYGGDVDAVDDRKPPDVVLRGALGTSVSVWRYFRPWSLMKRFASVVWLIRRNNGDREPVCVESPEKFASMARLPILAPSLR
ncbi:hypothetical protein [Ancylobacter koreensis]|uniref:hypothetical protein n=1 Tax=Ancylobacter koreensis TaxID=266121 RepID=UPI001FF10751|nr:hypothetical protein [Ancylobacter koreensis]